MKHLTFLLFLLPALASAQQRFDQRYLVNVEYSARAPYKLRQAVLPVILGGLSGACPNTEAGRGLRDGLIFGAAVSVTFGEKKPVEHYLFGFALSGIGFLAGRGGRELLD